jgi:serine protease AprX|tara:strand:+ start:448 stop:2343 length:1896 start_codon:yes stop_codon:yes gene_type:complete
MKNLVLLLSLLSYGICQAQSLSDGNKRLLAEYNAKNEVRKSRINSYLKNHPDKKKQFLRNNKDYLLYDVRNGKPVYVVTDNLNSAKGTKTIRLQPGGSLGLSLSGENYYIGVWDSGVVEDTHQEFSGGSAEKLQTEGTANATNHATHVAGTIAAYGTQNAAKGMAYNANIKSFDWNQDYSELINAANDENTPIYFSNHSYGFPIFNYRGEQNISSEEIGAYTSVAQLWDGGAFENKKLLIVDSAGNEGTTGYEGGMLGNYDKLTGTKTAKNNLVVANANPSFHPLSQELTGFPINGGSSQGPTDDLRIKPDIAGDGTFVYSSVLNNEYSTYSGTSMASPNVCGSLVLVHEYYFNVLNEIPNAATIKGIALHTASDDSTTPGPDPIFGWGLTDAEASAVLISSVNTGSSLIEERTLNQNEEYSFNITVQNGDKLAASISWTDPPGPIFNASLNNQTPVLMNDLDLRIIKDGQEFFPWKLELGQTSITAVKSDNAVDNFEKVEIDFPQAGTYTIKVSHKGNLSNPAQPPLQQPKYQEYTLIVYGDGVSVPLNNGKLYMDTLTIYPNPIQNGMLHIYGFDKEVFAQIRSVSGQLQWKGATNSTIDISHLKNGLYFISIDDKGAVKTGKFIIANK